jgi:hypothetical protein
MGLASIKNRLKKAQANNHAGDALGKVAHLLSRGAYYDELTEEERQAYKEYKESLGGVADDIAGAELLIFFGKSEKEAYHFQLTKRRRPPTPEEHAQNVREVEAMMQEVIEEYNTPEEVAKREAEYLAMTHGKETTP